MGYLYAIMTGKLPEGKYPLTYTGETMGRLKIRPGLLIGITVAAFFGISLLFRIYLPYGKIFVDDWVKLSGIDGMLCR